MTSPSMKSGLETVRRWDALPRTALDVSTLLALATPQQAGVLRLSKRTEHRATTAMMVQRTIFVLRGFAAAAQCPPTSAKSRRGVSIPSASSVRLLRSSPTGLYATKTRTPAPEERAAALRVRVLLGLRKSGLRWAAFSRTQLRPTCSTSALIRVSPPQLRARLPAQPKAETSRWPRPQVGWSDQTGPESHCP